MSKSKPTARDADKLLLGPVVDTLIRLALLAGLIIWCFIILRPFLVLILWGVIIAVAVYPVFMRFAGALGGRRAVAASLTTILILLFVTIPSVFLADSMIEGGRALASGLRDGTLTIPQPPDSVADWPVIGGPIHGFWLLASTNFGAALREIGPQLKDFGFSALGQIANIGWGLLQFVFAIIIAGVLLVYAESGRHVIEAVGKRLLDERGLALTNLAQSTVRGVARGIIGVALIQAVLAGFGFLAVGLPAAGLLAIISLGLAVIQIGLLPILLPAVVYVFATADPVVAVLFTIWSIFVGALDNILKPFLLGRGAQVPMLVIFMGAIGGFLSSGIIGLFVGAVVLAVAYELFVAWLRGDEPAETDDG